MVEKRGKRLSLLKYDRGILYDSHSSNVLWMDTLENFKQNQSTVIKQLQEKYQTLPLEKTIMILSDDPQGIIVVAPNPNRPGMFIFSDAAKVRDAKKLREKMQKEISSLYGKLGIRAVKL
ncbi:MAG: hypothetical protein O8C64_13115 [Candidatus Methanoperedens sp.]|nr:hypothetical protein [Candidatus Methanoperedens sp.]MCZ7403858.1 hypothetical protein [Candidatus Methanoperedens sp.]